METVLFDSNRQNSWNHFVASSPYGHILQSWEWGDVKAQTGWKALRLGLCQGEEIQAGAQVLLRELPYGLGKLAYVPKGPVLDYGKGQLLPALCSSLQDLAIQRGVISLKVEPEALENAQLRESLLHLGLKPAVPVQMRSTIWIDLSPPEEEILNRQKQKTRYNTRLAAKRNVIIKPGTLEDLPAWYEIFKTTAHRDRFSIHGLEYYQTLLRVLEPKRMTNLLLAHHDGQLLGGIIVFRFGNKAQYMYGASSNEKRNLMAPYLLQWEGMRWAKAQGATIYDLWGIPDQLQENEDLWGVYRHKRGYGGDIVRYIGAFDMVRRPLQHLALERLARPLFKRVARLGVQGPE